MKKRILYVLLGQSYAGSLIWLGCAGKRGY